ncbi:MAG: hypothetical protein HWE10_08875 [Gammaproteobacteria bacterium]|nr:hypothetical protein [Gammaproteobacteria bacterium]
MSLQRQLLALIISVFTLASFLTALYGYRNNLAQLEQNFDQELQTTAHFLQSIYQFVDPQDLTSNTLSRLKYEAKYPLVYQIESESDIVSSKELLGHSWLGGKFGGLSDRVFLKARWRIYTIIDTNSKIMVAQPIQQRLDAAETMLTSGIQPVIISLFIIAIAVSYIVYLTLKPVSNLGRQIQNKSFDDLSPLHVEDIPLELQPVLSKLNSLFTRLDLAFERERQLAANAAHELRTPISVLSITSHNLLEDFNHDELKAESLIELQKNVNRMAHVVEQILTLYRYSQYDFNQQKSALNLQELLQRLVAENYDLLARNEQYIELICEPIIVEAEPFALYTLFENLLRNANKYGGQGCSIQITVAEDLDKVKVTVADSGAGVEESQLEKIWQRFYRAESGNLNSQNKIKGAGLGLSIVKHIAELHHATLEAGRSELGGLAVSVSLPLYKGHLIQ